MHIKLVWENPNVIATTTKVYRGTQPLDRNALSNPLTTLTQGEVSWTDTTAVAGQRYYYVLESLTARDRAVSHNIEAWALPRTGPGPQNILTGDHEVGYYGSIPSSQFITAAELRTKLNFAGGSIATDAPLWMKFACRGKTLFIPEMPLAVSVAWKTLYDAGLVFGTNDDGSTAYTGAKFNQRKTVKIGLETFIVRLMTGGIPRADRTVDNAIMGESPTQTTGSEWDDLMYRACEWIPATQRGTNLTNKTRADFNSIGICLMQELVAGGSTSCLARGTTSLADKRALTSAQSIGITTTSAQWRPVLELVPDYQVNLSI